MYGLSSYELFGAIGGIVIAVASVIWWAARLDQRVTLIVGLLQGHNKKQKAMETKVQALHTVQGQHAIRIEKLEARAS